MKKLMKMIISIIIIMNKSQDATSLHPYITASRTSTKLMLSEVSIQVMCIVEEGVANACI